MCRERGYLFLVLIVLGRRGEGPAEPAQAAPRRQTLGITHTQHRRRGGEVGLKAEIK